jgi:hypothetical protein
VPVVLPPLSALPTAVQVGLPGCVRLSAGASGRSTNSVDKFVGSFVHETVNILKTLPFTLFA